jgi:hypothetical protein
MYHSNHSPFHSISFAIILLFIGAIPAYKLFVVNVWQQTEEYTPQQIKHVRRWHAPNVISTDKFTPADSKKDSYYVKIGACQFWRTQVNKHTKTRPF